MKAILMPGGSKIEIVDRERPIPEAGQVLIEVKAAGICGSDLHMQYLPAPERRRDEFYGLRTNPEVVPGHEAAGVVVEVGPGGSHLKVGDRVTVHHMAGCGYCRECRAGWDINCSQRWGVYGLDRPGALQQFMAVRDRDCVIVPNNITLEEACYYSCGAGTGYLALRRGDFGLGDTVAVVGLGPVGIAAAFFASRAGAKVIGFDTQADRNEFAEGLGLARSINPATDDVESLFAEYTDGHGADVVVEATGRTLGRDLAFSLAALHGRVVCVGFSDETSELHLQRDVLQKQVDVRGSWMFPIHQLHDMLQSMSVQNVSIEPLITHRFPLSESGTAWAKFAAGSLGKTIITN
jgi:2-desacetyl-2-hydroxyethyl bacteriochlorophyllide A dehydrogenase